MVGNASINQLLNYICPPPPIHDNNKKTLAQEMILLTCKVMKIVHWNKIYQKWQGTKHFLHLGLQDFIFKNQISIFSSYF
jgi:hypothetical protein